MLLCLCLVFSLCPMAQAATVAELTAQIDNLKAQLTPLENELERDYPGVVSVNGQIIKSNPLTVKVTKLFGSEYYVVQSPVADSTYMLGMYYNNYHKVTGSTVIYVDGVATNATVVGTGYPRAKELNRQINDLRLQLSDLDDKLYAEQLVEKHRPNEERNGHLKSLQSVRQEGVRLIFKVGDPYLLICGEETEATANSDFTRHFKRGQEVYPIRLIEGSTDYGAHVGGYNSVSDTPVVLNGVTMVAPRALVEWLGGSLDWDASTGVITCSLNGNTVVVVVGSNLAYVNGVAETMPGAVTVYNNSTVVPLRFFAEKLGCRVEWIPGGQYIRIYGGTNKLAGSTAAELPPEYSWAAPLLGTWKGKGTGYIWTITWNAAGQYVELKWGSSYIVANGGKLAYDEAGSLRAINNARLEKTGGNTTDANLQINLYDGTRLEAIVGSSPVTFTRW